MQASPAPQRGTRNLPGLQVISNDEMRDHHFGMLHSRAFLRWKERHVVHFDIPHGVSEGAAPRLQQPLPYSHVMQENAAGAWHLPRAGETPDSWVCLLPPGFGRP